MAATGGHVLALVELSEHYELGNLQSSPPFALLRDVFHQRLQHWLRDKDEWRPLNNNRACVILKDIASEGELELAAAKLERVFREPHVHHGTALRLLINAGFSAFGKGDKDMTLAMRKASTALNQAKQSAQLYQVYSPRAARRADSEAALLHRMRDAMEAGEFQLYFQPKIHAGYQNLVGAEALLRWHTPDRRILTPQHFIDVAERHDIIKPLTWWVIKAAVARLAHWPEDLSVAVNVSPRLLLEDDIRSVIADALDIHGVAAARLNLEVTEKIMVDNQREMLSQLHELRAMGIGISIDDFGTGFSSLAYFRDLPVDEIKIDQSFVLHMLRSEKDHAIVKAVIELAHNFSLRVVAEGVETGEIAERLTQLRCDILQGYFFDAPLPVERFEQNYRLRP